ncbi:MAG: methyltransferase domain-containing protein [Bacteroidota bacterium]
MKSPSYTSPDIGTAPINGNGHAPGTLSAPTLPMEHLPHELEGGTDFDEGRRGRNYRRANEQMPAVRVHELSLMLEKVAAQPGQRILDFGCGTGVLSLPVAAQVGATGEVVAVEGSKMSADEMPRGLRDEPNVRLISLDGDRIDFPSGSVDTVFTLASLHHVADKVALCREFYRLLRPGGRLIIGDVADHTTVQRFFDDHIHAHCSTGHDYRFLDRMDLETICEFSGIELQEWGVHSVPWVFEDEAAAGRYLRMIFDMNCSAEDCLDRAKRYLGYTASLPHFHLFWRLFYFTGIKPMA